MESLETPRLLLRPFAPDDAALVHAVYSDPQVMRYVATGPMADIALTRRLLEDYDAHQRRHGFSFWAVIERSSGTLIGDSGLYRTPAGEIELGYTLGAPWWGRGYATEAAGRWLAVAFDELGLDEVIALAEPANVRLAARAREAGDAARRRADRVRAPARGVPRSATGEQGFDPVQDPLEAELEGVKGLLVAAGFPHGRDRREALGVEVVLPELLALAPPLLVAHTALAPRCAASTSARVAPWT